MQIEVKSDKAPFQDAVSAEQAESLLEWTLAKPSIQFDLSASRPQRSVNPTVESTTQPRGRSWPHDAEMRAWLENALKPAV